MYSEYRSYKSMTAANKPTTPDIEGPFYKADAPFVVKLVDKPTMFLQGVVTDTDGKPVEAALLDFWQANEIGVYDNDGFALRGRQLTEKGGSYVLGSAHPGHYQIGPGEYRCGHIHVKITAVGFKPLTTQLYFEGDQYNAIDHWFDRSRLVTKHSTRTGVYYTFGFVLEKMG